MCASHAASGHALGWVGIPPVCDACLFLPVPDWAGERAYRWSRQLTPEPSEEFCTKHNSKISGTALWGESWGGSCDASEQRVVNLMKRMGLETGV